jgi:hypothetical protein
MPLYLLAQIYPSSMHAMVKHFQDKDQFFKVVIKQMTETQAFEDKLKEVS